jgi:hypothetical protein
VHTNAIVLVVSFRCVPQEMFPFLLISVLTDVISWHIGMFHCTMYCKFNLGTENNAYYTVLCSNGPWKVNQNMPKFKLFEKVCVFDVPFSIDLKIYKLLQSDCVQISFSEGRSHFER